MAGVSKTHSHDIVFDGALLSTTRASLVTELLQYFLYERQQIPLPVDQLRSIVDNARSDLDIHKHSDHIGTFNGIGTPDINGKENYFQNLAPNEVKNKTYAGKFSSAASQLRKVENLLDELRQLSDKLRQAFETCPEIEQVAVLFGGTIVSPKESYVIKFPPPCPDADSLSLKSCKRNLFQQVISEDFLGSLTSNLAPTNVSVLLSAPRSCPLQWFLPKQTLKSPKLGTIISLNFHCSYLVPICHDLTMADGEFELSGLELLNCSQCESECAGAVQGDPVSVNKSHDGDKDITEAGTATDVSRSHPHPDAVWSSIVQESKQWNDSAPPSPVIPRFCKHQMPNYIYSTGKNVQIKDTICTSSDKALITTTKLVSHSSNDKLEESVIYNMRRLSMSLSAPLGDETDCIWYQSPIVIRGLKKQDLFPGKKL